MISPFLTFMTFYYVSVTVCVNLCLFGKLGLGEPAIMSVGGGVGGSMTVYCCGGGVQLAALELFDCTEQPDKSFSLDASAEITCFSPEWFDMLPFAALAVFVYVCIHCRRRGFASVSEEPAWENPCKILYQVVLVAAAQR